MRALPGQPVCKHSVSMCFGRAPAPRAHSDSSRAGEGAPRLPLRAGPRWNMVSGCSRAWHCPSPALHWGQGQGRGRGQADCSSTLSSILSRILVAAHGFSRLLPRRPGRTGRRSAHSCLVGRLSGPEPLSCLLPARPQAGQPHPRGYFGLSAWSWVSSACSSPGVADGSFTKKHG